MKDIGQILLAKWILSDVMLRVADKRYATCNRVLRHIVGCRLLNLSAWWFGIFTKIVSRVVTALAIGNFLRSD